MGLQNGVVLRCSFLIFWNLIMRLCSSYLHNVTEYNGCFAHLTAARTGASILLNLNLSSYSFDGAITWGRKWFSSRSFPGDSFVSISYSSLLSPLLSLVFWIALQFILPCSPLTVVIRRPEGAGIHNLFWSRFPSVCFAFCFGAETTLGRRQNLPGPIQVWALLYCTRTPSRVCKSKVK